MTAVRAVIGQARQIVVNRTGWQTVGSSIGSILAGLVSSSLLARALGPANRGIYAALTVTATLIWSVSNLGAADALVFFVQQGRLEVRMAFRRANIVGAIGGVVAGGGLLVGLPIVLHERGEGVLLAASLVAAGGIPLLWYRNCIAVVQTRHALRLWNGLRLVGNVVYATLLGVVMVVGPGISIITAAAVYALSHCVSASVGAFYVVARGNLQSASRMSVVSSVASWWSFIRYGGLTMAGTFGAALATRVDVVVLAAVVPARDLGYYAVSAGLAIAPATGLLGLAAASYAKLSRQPGSISARQAQLKRHVVSQLFLGGISYGMLMLTAPLIVRALFGPAYEQSIGLLRVLSLGGLCYHYALVLLSVARAYGRPGFGVTAQTGALGVTIIGFLAYVDRYGVMAAAWVSVVSYGAMLSIAGALTVSYVRRMLTSDGPSPS